MDSLYTGTRYLKYRLSAGTLHDVHSPFVYDLLETVILDPAPYYAFDRIESVRARALLDNRLIRVTDYGTGGDSRPERELRVRYIASHFIKPKKYGQLLFRLVNRFRPKTILELGTSIGISTLYLAAPVSTSRVITLEGCPNTAAIARENFDLLKAGNIEIITGEFGQSLPEALRRTGTLDLVYFDGNHRLDATLAYFYSCLEKHNEHSLFIFDDIYRNREMTIAWNEIIQHPATGITIDLFQLGLVFFRKSIRPQHFTLRF